MLRWKRWNPYKVTSFKFLMFMSVFGVVFPSQLPHQPANPPKGATKRSLFLRKVCGRYHPPSVCTLCVQAVVMFVGGRFNDCVLGVNRLF